MPIQTILYFIGSGLLALFIALFQYIYKAKHNALHWSLAGLRFISIFTLLILIIHPKFEKLAIFNGFGTKGYMIGPLLAKVFVDYLLEGNELDQEVKLERFFNKVNF